MPKLLVWSTTAAMCLINPRIAYARGEDLVGKARSAVEKSTLDQTGIKPFHLKASFAPSVRIL